MSVAEPDLEFDELVAMSDEQVTLHLARAGISPEDMTAMWRRSCERWAKDSNPTVSAFGRELLEKERNG